MNSSQVFDDAVLRETSPFMLGSIMSKPSSGAGRLREGGSKRANMRALARNNAMSPNNRLIQQDSVPKSAEA